MNPALPPLTLILLLAAVLPAACQTPPNLLKGASLTDFSPDTGLPLGWDRYAGAGHDQQIKRVDTDKGPAMLLADGDPNAEIGISQTTAAKPGIGYEASVEVRALPGAVADGAFMQLRFLPSQQLFQVSLTTSSEDDFETVSVAGIAPADTTQAMVYLYSHAETTPRLLLRNARLATGGKLAFVPPPPVPPLYDKLKDLHLTTDIVKGGKAEAAIVAPPAQAYAHLARELQQAIQKLTGVKVPIVSDTSPEAAIPYGEKPGARFPDGEDLYPDGLKSNLIIIGNRSTNRAADTLYNLYYTLTDLKYPGPGGYEVRTLHNPFGDGKNIILLGCSDDHLGLESAVKTFTVDMTRAHPAKGELSVGRLMHVVLGKGVAVPKDLKQFETWEASRGYGSSGYFGWNCISKRMAMYYMTGDPFQAREALRLAFPDAQAMKDIDASDGEMIENKHDPLAGPYHYNTHMMILFWDLIEESPVFTDEERLKVTNAFARQLNHRKDEGIYGLTTIPTEVGSRHGQYSAISLYCLGRYFQRYYPADVWRACVEGPKLSFAPLQKTAFVDGENDNLYWYNTGHAPILTYMVLSGDRQAAQNGVLATLLRGQEALISGRVPDWALNYAALDFLNKAAYLTGDGRWLRYRERTQMDTNGFRLGQSFWPDAKLIAHDPTDFVGKWTFHPLPKPFWRARGSGLPLENSFFGSFRSAPDASGDFVLLDCFNGASRNPYHTFDILELRLNGRTLLQNYHNQVLTTADGMVEPLVPMDAALRYADVVGDTAIAVGEVPNAAYCNWRRSLLQRTGRYALIVDDLTFRTDSENMTVQTTWEPVGGAWDPAAQAIRIGGVGDQGPPAGWLRFRALDTACTSSLGGPEELIRLDGLSIMLLRATKPGAWVEMPFKLAKATNGEAFAELVNYVDRGTVRLYLDGKRVEPDYDSYAAAATTVRVPLGKAILAAGKHVLRVETVAPHAGGGKCFVGLSGVLIRPEGVNAAPAPTGYELRPCDVPMAVKPQDGVTLEWRGPVKKAQHRIQFSLLAPTSDIAVLPSPEGRGAGGEARPPTCVRVANNAAVLALPEPALAAVGEYKGLEGELVVEAADHMSGRGVTKVGAGWFLLAASEPVDVDWDFSHARLSVVAAKECYLNLVLEDAATLQMDGQPANGRKIEFGLLSVTLPVGRHLFTGAKPFVAGREKMLAFLNQELATGQAERTRLLAATGGVGAGVPARPPTTGEDARGYAWTATVAGKVVDTAVMGAGQLAVAEGKTVHVLAADGKEVRKLATDGPTRVLRYWPEAKLLLVGCTDEKVIAFDEAGSRKWVFVSQMDPAVYEAAKQYWFKSAPGHEGIHGLYSGVFLNGKSQAFVGSACTLEILDENGQLVKRLPVFWGPGHKFQIVDGPGGSLNLLIAREPTDSHALAIINNRTLDPNPRGFDGVPAGHTYVGGWACMSRDHIFHVDMDGDGKKEIVSEINGTWNRVTVWSGDGQALYNAQFGPGDAIPARNMRGLDVADLNGDGKMEIVTATSAGLLVALSGKCEKLWSKQLPSPATVLKCVGREIVVGCEDGEVLRFDGKGEMKGMGKVEGAPVRVDVFEGMVVMGTDRGEVSGWKE